MKKVFIILSLFVLIGCKTKAVVAKPEEEKIVKIIPNEAEEARKNKAYELGKRVLMTCNTSTFKPFTTNEATSKVRKNTTQEKLSKMCLTFRLKYGDFKDIKFVEVIPDKINKTSIYRFKANYEKKTANKELRVTMNQENKVSAINTKDWKDKYK
jgi:hypothetical protein